MITNQEDKNIIIYKSNDGKISFNVSVFEETVWLTQKQMAELFGVNIPAVNKHLKNIFESQELIQNSVISILEITAADGKKYNTNFYNLDAIISIGYRVNSERATQFRQWATKILKQYLINGYAINETRIRQIESSIDELVKSNKLIKEDVAGIKNLLVKLIERPIVIHSHNHNKISISSNKLEEKIIELLDQLIKQIKTDSKLKSHLKEIKEILKISPQNQKGKNKMINFFNRLGDSNSDLHKTIKGIGITKKAVTELVKLGEKLKDLILQ